jgi:hypothetical protein
MRVLGLKWATKEIGWCLSEVPPYQPKLLPHDELHRDDATFGVIAAALARVGQTGADEIVLYRYMTHAAFAQSAAAHEGQTREYHEQTLTVLAKALIGMGKIVSYKDVF